MTTLSLTESELRRLLAHATAAAIAYAANPTKPNYCLMVRTRAIFRGTMLVALRG